MGDVKWTVVRMFGLNFDAMSFRQAVDEIMAVASTRLSPVPYVVTPNVDHIVRLEAQPDLYPLYEQAAFRFVDGFPVEMFARLAGKPVPERVTGADLLPVLCQRAASEGRKVFMLGGPPQAAEAAGVALQQAYGTFPFAAYCPPMGFENDSKENRKILDLIAAFDPDLLFVGVGSPKQEKWIFQHRQSIRAGIALGVGAAIEFAAGTTARAPRIVRKVGMEWFWRMVCEPRRLARRYLGNFRFFLLAWREYQAGRRG